MRPMGVWGGAVRGAGPGAVPAGGLRVPRGLGGVGVVAEGVAVTRPTLLGLGVRAPLRDRRWPPGGPLVLTAVKAP
ncbi:hypothetical protein GCM10025782_22770 [Pedococcus ginsenosidimutans]|uniref:Uncharacterized protein n=1 Tax=Pedococcus ginsenosidimutans TaxID=490570 RepID=A0ABP8Y8N1_9MICO